MATFLALLAGVTSRSPSPSPRHGRGAADPGEIPASPATDAATTDVPAAPPSLAALLLALAATPLTLAAQAPTAAPSTGTLAESGSAAPAIAQTMTRNVPGGQPAVGLAGAPIAGAPTASAGAASAGAGADLLASLTTAATTTGTGAAPLSMTIGDATTPRSTATAGAALDTTTTAAAPSLGVLTASPDAASALSPTAASPATSPSALASREPTLGIASHAGRVESAGAPGRLADTPGLAAVSARLASDPPSVHVSPTGEPVELALIPAGALGLSSDAERSSDDPGERRQGHDQAAGIEAAASALGRRVEYAREGVGSTGQATSTAEDVVRQVAPRLAALVRSGRQEVVLRLDPPTLGGVRIEASLQGRELTLHIRADNAGARDLLEQGLPQLRQALERDGVTAGRISVELGLQADTGQPSHGTPFARPAPPVVTESPAVEAPRRASPRAVASSAAIDLWI